MSILSDLQPHSLMANMSNLICSTRTIEQDAEMMRLQLLGNPDLMNQLQQVCFYSCFPRNILNPLNGRYSRN